MAVRKGGNPEPDPHSPAWIFGSSRSGSTWLLKMLTDTGAVAPIDDPHIGHHLGVWRPIPLAWAAARECPELTTLTEVKHAKRDYFFSDEYRDSWFEPLRALITARFEAQARRYAAEHGIESPSIVVKEPASHAAGLLLELFPNSSLIFLLRDGRDVVDSWVDAYQGGSWAQEEGAFAVAPDGRMSLVRWLASVWRFRVEAVERAFARHDPRRRVLVRYEDLRQHPERELGRVTATLGLEVSEGELRTIAARRSYDRVPAGERGEGKEVRTAEPGAWRRGLTTAEQEAAVEIMGPKLVELGYLRPIGADSAPRTVAA